MNAAGISRLLRLLVLFAISYALYSILRSGSILTYVHPRSLPLITVSWVIVSIFALQNLRLFFRDRTGTAVLSWKNPVLLLPLILGIVVNPSGLSARAAIHKGISLRSLSASGARTGAGAVRSHQDTSGSVASGNGPALERSSRPAAPDTLNEGMFLLEVDKMYGDPDRFFGNAVTFLGFVALDTLLGPGSVFVGRMAVTCCAADAMPVGFYCTGDIPAGIKKDQWIWVTGKVTVRSVQFPRLAQERRIPVLRVTNVIEAEKPRRQYVYPRPGRA